MIIPITRGNMSTLARGAKRIRFSLMMERTAMMRKYPNKLPSKLWNKSSNSNIPVPVKNCTISIRRVNPRETKKVTLNFSASFQISGNKKPNGTNISILKMMSCSSLIDHLFQAFTYELKKSMLKDPVKFAPRLMVVNPSTSANQEHKRNKDIPCVFDICF